MCGFNVVIKVLKKVVPNVFGIQKITVIDMFLQTAKNMFELKQRLTVIKPPLATANVAT